MTTATEEKASRGTKLGPFVFEADQKHNGDLLIRSMNNLRLRGRIAHGRTVVDIKTQELMEKAQSRSTANMPEVPGQQLRVDPESCTVEIYDPLTEDPDKCMRIERRLKDQRGMDDKSKLQGIPTREEHLTTHQMKTLCRELYWFVKDKDGRILQGDDITEGRETRGVTGSPSTKAIDNLPGNYLLNPGSTIPNGQPQFEKDFPEYQDRLNRIA